MWTVGIQMYVTIAVNRNLSNCKKARKKDSGASTGFEPVASALALQCSTSLSYEDPHTGGRPIYWVHQPVKGMKHGMKWCELREYKWNEYVTIAVNRNLSNCEKAREKGFRGFNAIRTRGLCVSAAVLYQPELWRPTHIFREAGQFIEFINPWKEWNNKWSMHGQRQKKIWDNLSLHNFDKTFVIWLTTNVALMECMVRTNNYSRLGD